MEKIVKSAKIWAKGHFAGLFIFNLAIIVLVLLNTAGYFKPFFYLGINFIFFLSLLLAIFLLEVRSKALFLIAVFFLLLAALLKLAGIDIWADRASIYFFQSFIIGLVIFIWKNEKA